MKSILLIATGGTIASRPTEDGLAPQLCAKDILSCVPQLASLCQIDTLSYMVVCTEGPSGENSAGVTILQMANLCKELGAVQAYNLDGGNSAAVILNDEKLNNVTNTKKRMVGDCIYFCTLVP